MKKARNGYTVEQIERALRNNDGNVSKAAVELGAVRATVYNHINKSPTLAQVLIDCREELADLAESGLKKAIKADNITAIIFALKTVGKHRGYVERHELANPAGDTFRVEWPKPPRLDDD